MGAQTPARRNKTARELAEEFGVAPRTIQRLVAEPREEYMARARQRRERAMQLREQGLKYREIAEELGVPIGTVSKLLLGQGPKSDQCGAVNAAP